MASDIISTALIAIAGIIIVITLVTGLIPNIYSAAFGIKSTAADAGDRLVTSALVTNSYRAAPGVIELDVLNNGETSVSGASINLSVVYLGNETLASARLPRGDDGTGQYWNYTNIGRNAGGDTDGNWDPGETLVVCLVSPDYAFGPGEYQLKMVFYNNAFTQYRFGVEG